MALELADWLELHPITVTYWPLVGLTEYGAPQYSTTPQRLPTVVNGEMHLLAMPDGRHESSRAVLYLLSSSYSPGMLDKIEIPGSTLEPVRTLRVNAQVDEDGGLHHSEVYLG